MAQITTITEEQKARFPEWVERWTKIGLCTDKADYTKAVTACHKAYKVCNFEQPIVTIGLGSPYQVLIGGTMAIVMLNTLEEIGIVDIKPFVANMIDGEKVNPKTFRTGVSADLLREMMPIVYEYLIEAFRPHIPKPGYDRLVAQRTQIFSTTANETKNGVNNYRGGMFWASWCAYINYIEEVLGWENPVLEKAHIDQDITTSCGWVWWHEAVLVVGDRPSVINCDPEGNLHAEQGPSILYNDGWRMYHWHGINITGANINVIEEPSTITVKQIEAELNSEIRGVMIRRYGPERYMADSGAKVVHELPADHPIKGLRSARLLVKTLEAGNAVVYVDLLNSTPEPDGTTKRYMLRVDPTAYNGMAAKDVWAAAASTWRRRSDQSLIFEDYKDYAPSMET